MVFVGCLGRICREGVKMEERWRGFEASFSRKGSETG